MLRAGASAITLHELSKPGNRDTLAVVDTAYKVLQTYLKGNSRKNELYIAAHIPFFQSQVGAELAVERMYTELVRDNNQIVHAITDKEIMAFVELLKHDKQPQYLEFLSVLCECNGAPLPHNQEKIAHALLVQSNGKLLLFAPLLCSPRPPPSLSSSFSHSPPSLPFPSPSAGRLQRLCF